MVKKYGTNTLEFPRMTVIYRDEEKTKQKRWERAWFERAHKKRKEIIYEFIKFLEASEW